MVYAKSPDSKIFAAFFVINEDTFLYFHIFDLVHLSLSIKMLIWLAKICIYFKFCFVSVQASLRIFFFSSCFISICNPVGYDRLERLYILNSSLAFCLLVVHFYAVSSRLIHDFWGFSPPNFDLIWLNPQAVPPQPGHFFAAIMAPTPLPLFFPLLRLISKTPIRDPSLSH